MNKRGIERPMFFLGEIVGAAIIAWLLINTALTQSSNETPYMDYLAKDMALVIDSLFSSPASILINYTENTLDYSINFNEDSVIVHHPDSYSKTRKFIGSKTSKIDATLKEPDKIRFAKIGNEILIDNVVQANLNTLTCDELTGEKLTNKKILIDLGYEKQDIETSKEICLIANSFIANIIKKEDDTSKGFDSSNILSTMKFDVGEPKLIYCEDMSESDIPTDADVIISLRAGKNKDAAKNNIKAFIVSGSEKEKESKKLACLIINSILENKALDKIKITGVSIVPVDFDLVDVDFKEGIKDDIFVILEIGNTESGYGKNLLEKAPELGNSIGKGVMSYGK